MDSNLIIKKIYFEKDKIKNFNEYPFNIDMALTPFTVFTLTICLKFQETI